MKISVIIAVYNEEEFIIHCLESLLKQTIEIEIIAVDDGSTDNTVNLITDFAAKHKKIQILKQSHLGPAAARNLGSKKARGDILVFVDSDMLFKEDFVELLTEPIRNHTVKGTFAKNEFVANWENAWAKCWNYNQNISDNRRIPVNYPDLAPVFRAILAAEFNRVAGFTENIGWTDDWSLFRKLGYKSQATDAVCYHNNPQDLIEVYKQSMWIGKNEFISGDLLKTSYYLLTSLLPVSLIFGIYKSILFNNWHFVFFKIIYDFGIISGIFSKLITGSRNK